MDPSGSHSALATDNSDDENRRPSVFDVDHFCTVTSLIQQEKYEDLLPLAMKKDPPLNLMEDPVLNVVIEYKKTDLAKRQIQNMPAEKKPAEKPGPLWYANYHGDTALHVAATVGDLDVAKALNETPLHKAALYGHETMFWDLVEMGSHAPDERREDGATVLHCAIMGSAPALALKIAKTYPPLITSRNDDAVTPMQLTVTIPGTTLIRASVDAARWVHLLLFRILKQLFPMIERLEKQKKTHKETLELIEFLAYYPRHMEFYSKGRRKGKEESLLVGDITSSTTRQSPPSTDAGEGQGVNGGGNRDQDFDRFAEKLFMYMSHKDANHEAVAKELKKSMKESMEEVSGESTIRRWDEPPLILGAQMGLPEFVRTILLVCSQAAAYLDTKGRSVLQVAVMYRREEIVKIIMDMRNILPSWLFSEIEPKTGNTIVHLASRGSPDVAKEAQDEPDAMQLHYDLVWFETVRDMVPKELVYSRNAQTKTAEEMFTESHRAMLKSYKGQLMETGRTCSGLVAAVVFASSFSIPGDKDPATGNPVYFGRPAFKVFSHAYVIGLSCAATSLVLFLSLAMSPYNEQQFHRIIPTKYFFARSSFAMAMLSFLVAFTCNIYLQMYGWQKAKSKDLIPFVLELTVFPVICFLVLFFRGSDFVFGVESTSMIVHIVGICSFMMHVGCTYYGMPPVLVVCGGGSHWTVNNLCVRAATKACGV
uniref:PGG domain-containing protein n=1 Tax=Musa acuminata subsp. malaccensis TaxID=214687 RepID=A0A804I4Q6_MUSAM